MNRRREYQKIKNSYEIANKKYYRSIYKKWQNMSKEDKRYYIERAKHLKTKYNPFVVFAEDSKWIIHKNFVKYPSYKEHKKINYKCSMKKEIDKILLEIKKTNLK